MARDSSPFAQRFKALTRRPARPGADDAASGEPQPAAAESANPSPGPTVPPVIGGSTPPEPQPAASAAPPQQETADMPEDEQPTGEFPAIEAPASVTPPPPFPVPDAPLDPRATTDAPGAWPPPASEPAPSFEPVPATPIGSPDSSWTGEQAAPDQAWTGGQDGSGDPQASGDGDRDSSGDQHGAPDQGWTDAASTDAGAPPTAEPDDQPTTQMPALSPIWLDPPAYEQAPQDDAGAVEWSSPAEDVFEPVAPEPSGAPYAPIWEQEFEPADTGTATAPDLPAYEPRQAELGALDQPGYAAAGDAASADDVTPAWMDEAEHEAPASPRAAVPPPPRTDVESPTSEAPAPAPGLESGPTLSPPVLPAPQSTPDALDEALRLDDDPADAASAHDTDDRSEATDLDGSDAVDHDENAVTLGEASTEETPTAGTPIEEVSTVETTDDARSGTPAPDATADDPTTVDADGAGSDTQSTQIQDAVPAPPRRGGWRSAFGRRRSAEPTGDAAPAPANAVDQAASTEPTDQITLATDLDALAAVEEDGPHASVGSDATPDAVAEPVDLEKHGSTDGVADGANPVRAETATPPSDASGDASDTPDPEDPSSTGRFAAIGRLGKRRKTRKPAEDTPTDGTPPEAPTDADALRRAQAEQAEGGAAPAPEPEPVAVLVAEAPPLKPSFTERAALRRRAKSLRARRDAGLIELGAIVLDQSRFGDPTAGTLARRRTAELADLDNEIAAIEAVLEEGGTAEAVAQLGVVHCTSCSALVGPADRFCVQCGTPRPSASDATDASPAA